jgi:hypothetical protein
MKVQVKSKITKNINRTSILQQTAFWSEVKLKQGIHSRAFDIRVKESDLNASSHCRNPVTDDILILFKDIGDGCNIAYIPTNGRFIFTAPRLQRIGISWRPMHCSGRPSAELKATAARNMTCSALRPIRLPRILCMDCTGLRRDSAAAYFIEWAAGTTLSIPPGMICIGRLK